MKVILVNMAILLLSLCFIFFASEMVLRFFSHQPLLRIGHHKLFCEYDPLLGWKKIPNVKAAHKMSEYSVTECLNSKGIRGPEYSYHKAEGEHRTLILGDSFAEGYSVEFNDLFSEILKRRLNANGGGYWEVINAGVGGYSTDQEYLFFQTEGKKYKPDLTILMFYDNDVWYNNRPKYGRGYKPLFKVDEGELKLTNFPVPRIEVEAKRKKFIERIKEWFRENSYLYNFIAYKVKNFPRLHALAIKFGLAQNVNPLIANLAKPAHRIDGVPGDFRVYSKEYNTETEQAWRVTEALIAALKEETLSAGSELLVFYIPIRAAIYKDEWEATKKRYGLSDSQWDVNRAGIELEGICKRHNIDFINPTQIFKAEARRLGKDGKRLYFLFDGHWNIYGHRLAGELLAEQIKEK